jgi:hypothetical protein
MWGNIISGTKCSLSEKGKKILVDSRQGKIKFEIAFLDLNSYQIIFELPLYYSPNGTQLELLRPYIQCLILIPYSYFFL